ncbi:MAG: putative acetyltransferase [Ascidiaceihabitans sp.]|jgi:predicted acetyltransferase
MQFLYKKCDFPCIAKDYGSLLCGTKLPLYFSKFVAMFRLPINIRRTLKLLKLVEPTLKDKALFDRMAQLYSYDFSEINGWAIGVDGLFPAIKCFEEMWDDTSRYPRLILIDAEPVGFAIVRRTNEDEFDMEQFFLLRKHRRSGVGSDAAKMLFRMFSGWWTVEQIAMNKAAQLFWRRVISEYTDGDFNDTNEDDPIQSFNS